MKWYLNAHDNRWHDWTVHHARFGIVPTVIYSGQRPISHDKVIYHDEPLNHGSFIKRLGELLTDDEYYGITEYDCFIMDSRFERFSEMYMRENKIDILACHLRYEDVNANFRKDIIDKDFRYFSIGSMSLWSRRCLEWYSKNYTDKWCEIDYLDTPFRAGFHIEQNPYIVRACCNYDPTCQNVKTPRGMVLHPIKSATTIPQDYIDRWKK